MFSFARDSLNVKQRASTSTGTEHESDCWFGIQNARKRKQIQDRLAQRARRRRHPQSLRQRSRLGPNGRVSTCTPDLLTALPDTGKRLAEAKTRSLSDVAKRNLENAVLEGALVHLLKQAQTPRSITSSPFTESNAAAQAVISTPPSPTAPTIGRDTYAFPQPALSVYSALFDNGRILGLSCSCGTVHKSSPPSPAIPPPLHPTPTQLSTPHFQWIDRFPFPRMRDNMIVLCPVIDEEEFLADLFHLTSFTLRQGSVAWDPDAWKIGPEFAAKWGYLFF